MQFDVVQERQALVETGVSSLPKPVEGGVGEVKQGLNALSDDVNKRMGKLEQNALVSTLETAGTRYANTLKGWTGKTTASVIYDSTVDEFTDDGLFYKVKGRPNIAIIATTSDGDVFGGFYSVAVTEQDEDFHDPNMFIFSFESHGRCMTPQRFVVKVELRGDAGVRFFKNYFEGWFVAFDGGAGGFFLGNEKSRTWCSTLSFAFEGIENTTLTGNTFPKRFTCCRLIAIQLE